MRAVKWAVKTFKKALNMRATTKIKKKKQSIAICKQKGRLESEIIN